MVDQPGMRQLGAGPGGRLVVELDVALPDLVGQRGVGQHRRRDVAVVLLHSLGVPLVFLQLQGRLELLPPSDPVLGRRVELRQGVGHRVGVPAGVEAVADRRVVEP
ncbi:hypothetical protein SDC9_100523 [bioreactor metagenome]|uniref:Uncharacterized protein n=1 Tax=bioreactor metagenome TaxID=1076179 RepID=A0A645AW43_9ZZZZ